MIKKTIWTLVAILTVCSHHYPVLAKDNPKNTGFSISPAVVEVTVNQKDLEQSFVLNISNYTAQSAVFKLSVVDFGSLEASAGVAFFGFEKTTIDNKYSLASWIRLEKDAFVVDPGKIIPVKITIVNRESLSPGGHYGAVLVKMDQENVDGQKSVGITQSYASLIFVKKTGGEIYKLNLLETTFGTNPLVLADSVKLRFQNAGNVHLVPRGKIEVTDPAGRLVLKGIINPDSAIIMPESFRNYEAKLNRLEPLFYPGKYSLKVNYRFQGSDTNADYQTNFVYLGGWLTWGLIAVFLVLIIGLLISAILYQTRSKN
jgi:hypothetical protein